MKDGITLAIDNRFGKIDIKTTQDRTIQIEVEIVVERKSESRAQEILDDINIDIAESTERIAFKTELGNDITGNHSGGRIEINYYVSMPKNINIDVINHFGNVYAQDISGWSSFDVAYGNFYLSRLENQAKVKLSYGNGELKYMAKGEFKIKYSKATLFEAGEVNLEQGFSDVNIEVAKNLSIDSKYGNLEIGELQQGSGEVGYSGFEIGKLKQSLKLDFAHVGLFEIEQVDPSFQLIDINGKFSSIKLQLAENTSGNLDIWVKYADFDAFLSKTEYQYVMNDNSEKQYKGTFGNGQGGKIHIISSYGSVKIRQ